jgi:general secretion pathway protein G
VFSKQNRKAFTMIELIFVIVVIGILSAIAVPKFAATRDDAVIVRARDTVASLRSALSTLRQKNILKGTFDDVNGSALLNEIEYGLSSDWNVNGNTFTFTAPDGSACIFTINNNRLETNTTVCSVSGLNDL